MAIFKRSFFSYIQLILLMIAMNLIFVFLVRDLYLIYFGVALSIFHMIILSRMIIYPAYFIVSDSSIVVYSLFKNIRINLSELREIRIALSPLEFSYFRLESGGKIRFMLNEIKESDRKDFERIFSEKIRYR